MSKLLRKAGHKFSVILTVHHLVLKKPGNTLDKDSTISIAVERGSHLVTSAEKDAVVNSTKDAVVEFHESLTLDATLYPVDNTSHKFQEKIAKVMIRKRKKTFLGSSHQIIGQINLPIHELVREEMPIDAKNLLQNCTYPGSDLTYSLEIQPIDDPQHRPSLTAANSSHLNTSLIGGGGDGKARSSSDLSAHSVDPFHTTTGSSPDGRVPKNKMEPIKVKHFYY
jgi:hypothetical protein